jgi:lipopolysaccharide/colanic/teichoic acid biosynthesis glycosyltransferase
MTYSEDSAHHAITTTENQPFTIIGPFLRRCKLDELPQLFNVLIGNMSLVGARPKLPEHQIEDLQCRPGITGAATIAFAHEARFLARVPAHLLDDYYRTVVLPTKSRLDVEYMAHATFFSDLKLLVNTVLCRWDGSAIESLLNASAPEIEDRRIPVQAVASHHMSMMARNEDLASAEQSSET